MGNWKTQKYKRKTVIPKRISHRQIAKINNPSIKYIRLNNKNLYTSLINIILDKEISKIEVLSSDGIHSSVKCSIYDTSYFMAIKTPVDNKVEFIHNLVQSWNEEKQAHNNLSNYEMLLYLSFNEKSSPIKEFKKIPLSKSKKIRLFYTLSLDECYKLYNNEYAGLGDLIPLFLPWIKKKPGKDGTVKTSIEDDNSKGGGGGIPKYRYIEAFGFGGKPGPHLAAAKVPPRDIGGFGGTGLDILRSTHINPKEIIKDNPHDKKTKGEYGNVVVTVQDKKPRDTLIQPNGSEWKARINLVGELIGENGERIEVYAHKPIEGKNQKLYHHTGGWRITGHIKEDEVKGGQRTTHRRASSVAACKKKGKRKMAKASRQRK